MKRQPVQSEEMPVFIGIIVRSESAGRLRPVSALSLDRMARIFRHFVRARSGAISAPFGQASVPPSKVNCLKYESSAKGVKIGPFPRYRSKDRRPLRGHRQTQGAPRNPEDIARFECHSFSTYGHSIPAAPPSQEACHGEPIPSRASVLNRGDRSILVPASGLSSNANRPKEHSR